MKPSHIVVLLALFIGVMHAFSVTDYLYANETPSMVSTENFTLNGVHYSIVKVGGNDAFLLSEGSVVQDQGIISSTIHSYYISTRYPTSSDLSVITGLLKAYNDSKNNGEMQPGKEDNTCRQSLFIDGRVKMNGAPVTCINDTSCQMASYLLYSYGADAFGWSSPTQILGPLESYAYASFGSEKLMTADFNYVAGINEGNVYDNLKAVDDSIPQLKTDEKAIESSQFRFPVLSDPTDVSACQGFCYGICPPLHFDAEYLDQLDSSLSALLTKVAPLSEQTSVGQSIYSSTINRMKRHSEELNASYYSSLFDPLAAKAASVISAADSTNMLVKNDSFEANLTAFKSLDARIKAGISSRDFSTIDSDLARYSVLLQSVKSTYPGVYAVYNQSVYEKSRADSLVFVLDTKDLDPLARSQADVLKNQTKHLDDSFDNGLDEQEYVTFNASYSNISTQAENLLRSTGENPGSMMLLSFRAFARKVNGGLATFISSSKLMPLDQVPENKVQTFGGFSAVTLLSFGAMCLLSFLGILVLRQPKSSSSRYVLAAVFLIALVSVTAFAAFMFIYLDRTSSNADVGEFLADVGGRNNTSVVIDLRNTPPGYTGDMESCGKAIANSISSMNKTVWVYSIGPSQCDKTTFTGKSNYSSQLSDTECITQLQNMSSLILLNYTDASEKSAFSVIYTSRAYISSDSTYYKSCPFASLFNDQG